MIFAFGHQKHVGKDEFVKFCFDILRPRAGGKKILRRGFADKLYDICYQLYAWAGFRERSWYVAHPDKKSDMLLTGHTVRDTLIQMSEKIKEWDPDIWINANLREAHFDHLFISDCRFPHEVKVIKELGGKVIKITRPGLPEPTDVADCALNGFNDWDIVITNDGDLNDLYDKAGQFVDRFFPRTEVVI